MRSCAASGIEANCHCQLKWSRTVHVFKVHFVSTCHEVYVNKMYSQYNGCMLITLSLKYVHAHQNFTCRAAWMVIRGEGGSAQACFCFCFGETGKWLHAQNLTHFWVHFKLSRRVKAIICEHALVICQKASWQGIEQNTCIYILMQATKTYCTLQQTHYICTQLLCLLCEVLHFT